MAFKVFVGNLNFETTSSELQAAFADVGQVIEVFIPTDRATGRPRGFAFVELGSEEDVTRAIQQLDGFELKGRRLRVNKAEDKPRGPRPPRAPRPPRYASGPPEPGGFDGPPDEGFGGDNRSFRGPDAPPKRSRPKGSRRNARGKKRSL